MTGTGTQQDPFKPTSWPELLSVSTSNTVFIELPQGGGTFNMNDYYPEGIVQTIILKGNINGNGWTIKNPDYMGSYGCFDIGNAKKTKLHFINCKGKSFVAFPFFNSITIYFSIGFSVSGKFSKYLYAKISILSIYANGLNGEAMT